MNLTDFLRDWIQTSKVFSRVMNLGASETAPSLKCSESTSPNPRVYSGGDSGEDPTCQCRRHKRREFDPWVGKIPLEEGMATHSSSLAWESPWTEEPYGLQPMGSQRV